MRQFGRLTKSPRWISASSCNYITLHFYGDDVFWIGNLNMVAYNYTRTVPKTLLDVIIYNTIQKDDHDDG